MSSPENGTFFANKMAGVEGFEPPTIGFGDRCSTNWNYTPKTHSDYRIQYFYPTTQILVTSTL
jgi:hypothetical protein